MLDLKSQSAQLNNVIARLLEETKKDITTLQGEIEELEIKLQGKDMHVDRSENQDFQIARDTLDMKAATLFITEKRRKALEEELQQNINDYYSTGRITLGATVAFKVMAINGDRPTNNNTYVMKIVRHDTSDAISGLLAEDTPAGIAMLGHTTGDQLEVNCLSGRVRYLIEGVY